MERVADPARKARGRRDDSAARPSGLWGGLFSRIENHWHHGPNLSRLAVRAATLLLLLAAVQAIASLAFYNVIDKETLREDHARRVAELLVVSQRLYEFAPDELARTMSTSHLEVELADAPRAISGRSEQMVGEIHGHILHWEPTLAGKRLILGLEPSRFGYGNLVGAMQLPDGHWLNFRSLDVTSGWPIALRATVLTLITAVVGFALALWSLRIITRPLRELTDAADAIGQGMVVPVQESGPDDLRSLARSMNTMQARIAATMEDQARSFEAISHDLRTPLSRVTIAADLIDDAEIAGLVRDSTHEMEAMLMSLQQYLRAQHIAAEPEAVDLGQAVADLLGGQFPGQAKLEAAPDATVQTFREPLVLALKALVENAIHYGGFADVQILPEADGRWIIAVEDTGPGIPEDQFERILAPFYRIDEARARDTAGFGLGIPTAHRLLQRFGGGLAFARAAGGGLRVAVTVPIPPELG
ncbi:MAG: HAMP domain-containing sensor histidine kinase [Novosphingobium sp.]|uniref:ATP-binding protein n=1 Tax=Novosphingobium sp. TaxID=1874826 RepID=UPI002734EF40|nr:HAMP domain-containing sensor histidine kinase [Novosphingobium sp.]MDP3551963.1 HAMP domain-containing sensor histidine kinase [Novosphingobium sp.]